MGKVAIVCEESATLREAFRARGHHAVSYDLQPSRVPGLHVQGDVLTQDLSWADLIVAHPPCTHIAVSGAAWFERKRANGEQQAGIDFFMAMTKWNCRWAIENPVGIMSTIYRAPDQIIHPWMFGDEASKATCLWLNKLPRLSFDDPLFMEPNIVGKGEFYEFASGRRQAKWYADAWGLPQAERSRLRSKTFDGIANAMADQWGSLL